MKEQKTLIKNYWIFNADIEAYGKRFFERHKYIKGYAFLAKNINSEEGVITDKDYFNLDIVDFIYRLFDTKLELSPTKKTKYFETVQWKKVSKRRKIQGVVQKRKYWFERDVYFHNGGKYDLHFFLPIVKKLEIIDKRFKIENLFFMKKNEILNFTLSFTDTTGYKRFINFKDSYKIFPVPLKMLGDSVKLPKLDYEEYDFLTEFKNNHAYFTHNKGKSIKYFIRDVDIVNRFFKKIDKFYSLSNFKLTIASTAYKEWEKTVKEEIFKYKNSGFWTNPRFKVPTNFYPEQWLTSKRTYRGGWTYVNPRYQFKVIDKIYKYDVNSLFPSKMYYNKFPYGKIYEGDRPGTTYKELRVDIMNANIKSKKFPFIPKKNIDYIDWDEIDENFVRENEYPSHLKNQSYFMNNYEYNYFQKCYEGDWTATVLQSMYEKTSPFIKYIDYWMRIKEQASKDNDDALKLFAKLMLNSLYGKFGQKIDVDVFKSEYLTDEEAKDKFEFTEKQIWYIEEDTGRRRIVLKNGNTYNYATRENRLDITKARLIPIASKITALAKIETLTAANANYDYFIYADTDSIHLTKPAIGIEIDKTKLGFWKYEGRVEWGVYRRPKHYLNYGIDDDTNECKLWKLTGGGFNVREINSDKYITKMNDFANKYKTLNEFTIKKGKVISNVVNGGVLIHDTDYKFTLPMWMRG